MDGCNIRASAVGSVNQQTVDEFRYMFSVEAKLWKIPVLSFLTLRIRKPSRSTHWYFTF